jgi:hypothetical protein
MRRFFSSVLCCTFLFCGIAAAQGGFRPKVRTFAEVFADQRRVIGAWCRLDFEGARLDKKAWPKFAPLTSMTTEPEFSSFYVVSRYQVLQPEASTNLISVSFYELGEFRPESGFRRNNRVDTVDFETGERDGETVIRDLRPSQPRVSRQAAINWLRQQSEAAKTDSEKFTFEQALKDLATPPQPAPVPETGK